MMRLGTLTALGLVCACTQLHTAKKTAVAPAAGAAGAAGAPVPASGSAPTPTPAPSCANPKSPSAFITAVVQDMSGTSPRAEELAMGSDPNFSRAGFVDYELKSARSDDAITRFVGNLFRVSNIVPDPNAQDPVADAALVADLAQEPIILALRNKEKPWSYLWQTQDIYCTARTAKLYNFPLLDTSGFVSCTLPPERAGFLGLVSVLRATSTSDNPQAFYKNNNNYHRVAATIYFAKGIQLLQKTNGPTGTGKGIPMADCVPVTDQRTGKGGLVFGTAAIPLQGPVCASCHSPDMGPLSIAFRKFDTDGSTITSETLQNAVGFDADNVTPIDQLQALLAESNSCWAPDGVSPPSSFDGLAGLGQVIANAPTLGHALGVQIPQMLSNVAADQATTAAIESAFKSGDGTLLTAMRGYFLSPTYQCN